MVVGPSELRGAYSDTLAHHPSPARAADRQCTAYSRTCTMVAARLMTGRCGYTCPRVPKYHVTHHAHGRHTLSDTPHRPNYRIVSIKTAEAAHWNTQPRGVRKATTQRQWLTPSQCRRQKPFHAIGDGHNSISIKQAGELIEQAAKAIPRSKPHLHLSPQTNPEHAPCIPLE